MKKRMQAIGIVAMCVLLTILIGVYGTSAVDADKQTTSAYLPLTETEKEEDPLDGLDEAYRVRSDFSSNLPLVVLDMGDKEPPISTKYSSEEERHIRIPGVEPYIDGTITLISGNETNKLSDSPQTTSDITIKRRGNSSMKYDKPQYLMKLLTEKKEKHQLSLLGMGNSNEWILNGSMTDRSLMRNYLCYRISSEIMDYTPDYQYCEVFIKKADGYHYQGIYLLGENIRQGESRVAIDEAAESKEFCSYIIRRDRYDEEAVNLDTWATREGLTYGQIELIYPGKNSVTDKQIAYVQSDIEKIEKVLYSNKKSVFQSYPDYLDVDSFVDYFIINEYFGNYDAGENSTYMYKNSTGKLCIGPVWDFDGAIDNYYRTEMVVDKLSFYTAPWFDRLVLDKNFVRLVKKRYESLRKSSLSDEHIYDLVEEIRGSLINAKDREWKRWSYDEYNAFSLRDYLDDEGLQIYREATVYEKEIYKLKTVLKKHAMAIPTELKIKESQAVYNTGWNDPVLWFGCCVLIFIIPILYVGIYR